MYNSEYDYLGYWGPPPPPPMHPPPPPGPHYPPGYNYQGMPHPNHMYPPMGGPPPPYMWNNNGEHYTPPPPPPPNPIPKMNKRKPKVAPASQTKRNFEQAFTETESTENSTNATLEDKEPLKPPGTYTSPIVPKTPEKPETTPQAAKPNSSNLNRRPLPVKLDPSLPEEVAALHKNSKCELCDVKMTSRIQAKAHYEGKPHAKKLKMELAQRKNFNGEAKSLPVSEPPSKKKKTVIDGSQLYCKCCDLSFTSVEHATQHYLGRNHQRVLHGFKPLKAGYYNSETGCWQRMPLNAAIPAERLENPDPDAVKGKGKFFCDLCCVSATSQDQLDGHLQGQRHKKAFSMNAKKPKMPKQTVNKKDSILASIIKGNDSSKTKQKDLSIYRTPSGKYYCASCDTIMNSENQCAIHVDSKKHLQKKK